MALVSETPDFNADISVLKQSLKSIDTKKRADLILIYAVLKSAKSEATSENGSKKV